ncbi:MAG: thiol-disulfide oxidoreductase DCC family protein [Candidatus Melainabacteria bacterium]
MVSDTLSKLFFRPRAAIDVAWIRIVVFGYFLYKLLSRDYTVFGFAPPEILSIYPTELFNFKLGYAAMGVPWVVSLATFHWVHWFLPLPDVTSLGIVQALAIACCAGVVVLGKGPRNLFAIGSFILISYLWGFNWRSGAEVDAVFMGMQMMLVYCFFREPEALILSRKRAPLLQTTAGNGWLFSMALIVFSLYYFYSGINKVLDITYLDWFKYDLAQLIGERYDYARVGHWFHVLPGFQFMRHYPIINVLFVPVSYLMELTIPAMFFRRDWVKYFAFFFLTFHTMTWAVSILFFGNLIMWFSMIPVHRFMQPVTLVWDSDCTFCGLWVNRLMRLNWLGLIQPVGSAEALRNNAYRDAGWRPDIVETSIWVHGENSPVSHVAYDACRRLAWATPLLWPLLPLLYMPGVGWAGERVYAWVAANRYRLGCATTACQLPT